MKPGNKRLANYLKKQYSKKVVQVLQSFKNEYRLSIPEKRQDALAAANVPHLCSDH